MTQETQIQALLNKCSLLMKCVEFYADENNYVKKMADNKSQIDLDNGFVAKHTIETLNKLSETEAEMVQMFEGFEGDPTAEDLLVRIKEVTEKFKQQ